LSRAPQAKRLSAPQSQVGGIGPCYIHAATGRPEWSHVTEMAAPRIRRRNDGVPESGGLPARRRPTLRGLVLSVAVPALAAGALTAYLVLPARPADEPPVSKPPAEPPPVSVPAPARPTRPAPPLGISIPAVGAQGPVDPVGEVAGQLEIPPPGRAGWFDAGPRPGEAGRAVIVSHVDSREGPALFASLRSLRHGTTILIEDRRGGVHRFRVVHRREIEKASFPVRSVYGPSRRPVLVLVTCGGPFTPGKGYRDSVILYARAA
jgi:Sortase domain